MSEPDSDTAPPAEDAPDATGTPSDDVPAEEALGDDAALDDRAATQAADDVDATDGESHAAAAAEVEGENPGETEPFSHVSPPSIPSEPLRYDFVHPEHKFGVDWPLLDLVNGQAASAFAAHLGKRLQLKTRGAAEPTGHMRYGDFIAAHRPTTLVHEVSLAPLPGVLWVEFDASLVFSLVDAYFGGEGQVMELVRAKTLSNTERRVVAHVLAAFVDGLRGGWQALLPTDPELVRLVASERLGRAGHEQIVARSCWMLAWPGGELPVEVTYPHAMLEPVGVKLERDEPTRLSHQSGFGKALGHELLQCDIELSGVVGETRVSLSELLSMKPGDFIPLRDVQTVRFESQGTPVFDAVLGVSNGCVSASLSNWHLPGILSS